METVEAIDVNAVKERIKERSLEDSITLVHAFLTEANKVCDDFSHRMHNLFKTYRDEAAVLDAVTLVGFSLGEHVCHAEALGVGIEKGRDAIIKAFLSHEEEETKEDNNEKD